MLERMDTYKEEFYRGAIALQNDIKLRKLAGSKGDYGFAITGTKVDGGFAGLSYRKSGFVASIPKYETGSWGGYRDYRYLFKVEDNKLFVRYHKGKKELLELFPKTTVEDIIQSIEAGIKKLPIYKTANGGN